MREVSVLRDVATNASQSVTPTTRPAPQSTAGARAHLPAVALGCHELNGDSAIAPASTWWNTSKRKRMIPVGQTDKYIHTRSVRSFLSLYFSDTNAL
jgi:abelson tyrosine-protein kinase 1